MSASNVGLPAAAVHVIESDLKGFSFGRAICWAYSRPKDGLTVPLFTEEQMVAFRAVGIEEALKVAAGPTTQQP